MNSLFLKNFILYSLVIVLSFTILGGAYTVQINRYAIDEKQTSLEQTASRAAQSTSSFVASLLLDQIVQGRDNGIERAYRINMMQLAAISGGMIFVSDLDGNLLYIARSDGW